MRYLGNLIAAGKRITVQMCVFVDATGLIVVHATHSKASAKISIVVESYAGDCEEWVTQASADTHARPAYSHVNLLAVGTPLDAMLSSHRAFTPFATPDAHLATFRSIEDAANMYDRANSRFRAWRGTLPREELLQMDLRTVLGTNYDGWSPGMTRRLQKLAIPRATVRR